MENNPLISIVLCAFNEEYYIEQAIDSIMKQTYSNWELIVIDDGSTDNTSKIVTKYCYTNPKIKLIHQENGGIALARNRGITAAKGDFIAFHDADDISSEDRLLAQITMFNNDNKLVMVGSDSDVIDVAGKKVAEIRSMANDEDIRLGMLFHNQFVHGSVMAKRRSLEKVGGFKTNYGNFEDYELWLRLLNEGTVANITKHLYCWRLQPRGLSYRQHKENRYWSEKKIVQQLAWHYMISGTFDLNETILKKIPNGFENDKWYRQRLSNYRLECAQQFFSIKELEKGRIMSVAARCSTRGAITGIPMFFLSFIHPRLTYFPFFLYKSIEKHIKTPLYKAVRDTYSLQY